MTNNDKTPYQLIGSSLGATEQQLRSIKTLYGIAAKELEKYVRLADIVPAGTGTVVTVAVELVKLFSGAGNDERAAFDAMFEQIRGLIKAVEAKIDATSKQQQGLALAGIEAAAKTVHDVAARYRDQLAQQRVGAANTETTAFEGAAFLSADIVNQVQESAFWVRLYDPSAVCDVPGSQRERYAPAREADVRFVWDYRAALPVLLKVVSSRIAYLSASDADFRVHHADELSSLADFVTDVHDRIQSGFILIEAPCMFRNGVVPNIKDWQHTFQANWDWDDVGRPCGAVDSYGGVASIERFPLPQPRMGWLQSAEEKKAAENESEFGGLQWTPESWAAFRVLSAPDPTREQGLGRRSFNQLYLARALRARADLDVRAGLPELREVIAQLRRLAGRPGVAPAPTAIAFGIRQIADPSDELRAQLARPLRDITRHNQVMLPFLVEWPSDVALFTDEFTKHHAPGSAGSMAAVVVGT